MTYCYPEITKMTEVPEVGTVLKGFHDIYYLACYNILLCAENNMLRVFMLDEHGLLNYNAVEGLERWSYKAQHSFLSHNGGRPSIYYGIIHRDTVRIQYEMCYHTNEFESDCPEHLVGVPNLTLQDHNDHAYMVVRKGDTIESLSTRLQRCGVHDWHYVEESEDGTHTLRRIEV